MKKIKFEGKLNLNKETVAKLNDKQMDSIKGGKFGSSANGGICVCTTSLFNCNATDLGCDTRHNCPNQ